MQLSVPSVGQEETAVRLYGLLLGLPVISELFSAGRNRIVHVGKHRHRQAGLLSWDGRGRGLIDEVIERGLVDARIDIAHAIIVRVVLLGIRTVLVGGLAAGAAGGVTGGSLHALFCGAKWQARVQLTPDVAILDPVIRVDPAQPCPARRASTAGPSTPRRPAPGRNRGTAATWRPSLKRPLPSAC